MYPLQLLTGNVLLASILGMPATTLQLVTAGRELISTASPPTVSEMPASPTGTKWWHHSSNQEATMLRPEEEEAVGLDITLGEQSHQKTERREAPGKAPQGEPPGSLCERLQNLSKVLGGCISRCIALATTTRGPTSSTTPSRRWPPLLISWALMCMRSRRHGLVERTSKSLTTWRKVPQRTSVSSGWCLPLHCPRSWT